MITRPGNESPTSTSGCSEHPIEDLQDDFCGLDAQEDPDQHPGDGVWWAQRPILPTLGEVKRLLRDPSMYF